MEIYLYDDKKAHPWADIGRLTVHACHDIHNGLAKCDHHAKYCQQNKMRIINLHKVE